MCATNLRVSVYVMIFSVVMAGCSKKDSTPAAPPSYSLGFTVNGTYNGITYKSVILKPVITFKFVEPVSESDVKSNITFSDNGGAAVSYTTTMQNNNKDVVLQPSSPLNGLTKYTINVPASLKSAAGGTLLNPVSINLQTGIDSTDKFPKISDSALLTLVEQQTFKYFWDFGHPVSGMARERNTSGDVVTTGGSGFGVMAMLAAIDRNFITRADGLNRITTIVNFLSTKCTTYHGAFSHWIDGATGATVPFSPKDNGGDIVETAYMLQGLLCARQYFNSANAEEISLRNNINALWDTVDWNWYRNNSQNVLYWNWSPDQGFVVNVQVQGWDEALITYVLAASSNTNSTPKMVYDNGWAKNGGMKNGKSFYGINLPLGPDYGGPLFFAHYSFLGINPHDLKDAYANYWTQDTAHAKINYKYCVTNPNGFAGYSNLCWGLTASDIEGGYTANSPTNDAGYIAPTAAIASLPYTPTESMNALKFFYYKLGDKLWGQYGFTDAFNINNIWFADSYLAIDQGPEIVMIENYRSGLLWKLFMSCPEIKTGMKGLGFTSPNL
jgi:hypothetical protein